MNEQLVIVKLKWDLEKLYPVRIVSTFTFRVRFKQEIISRLTTVTVF